MAFHVRAALVAITAVLLTAGYCAWQLSHAAQKHFNEQKINVTTQQLALTKKQVEDYVDKTANELTALIQNEINQASMTSNFTQSDFVATAVSSLSDANIWSVDWFRTKNTPISLDFFNSKLTDLSLSEIQNDKIQVGRLEAPDKRIYFTVSVSIRFKTPEGEAVKVATGLVPISYFQSLLDATKGSTDEGLLVDSKGFAVSYPDQQYVGAKIDTHPIVKEAMQSSQGSEVIFSQNIKGDAVVGGYEKLGQSNLMLVMSSPVMSRSSAMLQSILQIILFCMAMMLVVAGVMFFLGKKNNMKHDILVNRIKVLEQRQQNPAELSNFIAEQTKKEILREFAFGVVQILKNPMTAIIGQAQLLKDKATDTEQKNLIGKIERETRQSRDFVEQLAKSYGLNDIKLQTVEVETVVTPVLSEMVQLFIKHDVQIEENVKTRARVSVPHSDLKLALRHVFYLLLDRLIIKNGFRKISVNIEQAGPHIFIKMSDNAAKPEKDFLAQIFNPFKVSGLNFNLLKSLVESADGLVTAKESDGGGLEITIQLTEDKSQTAEAPAKPVHDAKAEPRIEIPIPESVDLESIMNTKVEKAQNHSEMKLVDVAASFALPEVPTQEPIDAEVKKSIVADEALKVTIRKPKTSFES
jgi:signal transduction histidine kinase